jgi:CRISPR type I-D-associated protein Csc1
MRLFRLTLQPHDPLWFSSVEFSGQLISEPVIHPYALTFALANSGRVTGRPDGPDYDADLPAELYCLAAEGFALERVRLSYNAVDEMTNRTDTRMDLNTPRVGQRLAIQPSTAHGFMTYLFTRDDVVPRRVVRVGKKRAAVRVEHAEISPAVPRLLEQATEATHLVNPLDIRGDVRSYVPVHMAPHLLLREAVISNDWFILVGSERIHVPHRVMAWLPSA